MEEHKKDIVHVGPASLQKVSKHISVAKKVLFEDIKDEFNRAFCLLYCEEKDYGSDNHLLLLETQKSYKCRLFFDSFTMDYIDEHDQKSQIATALLENILIKSPKHIFSFLLLGTAFVYLNNQSRALEIFDQAILISPHCADLYYSRAWIKSEYFEKHVEAIEDCTKAIMLEPDHVFAHIFRSDTKSKMEDWEGAIRGYNELISLGPQKDKPRFC